MPTLADIRTRVANDLSVGTALNAEIVAAINDAVQEYDAYRFWFNEKRTLNFNCVIGQAFYGDTTSTDIKNLIRIDQAVLTYNNGGARYPLQRTDNDVLEVQDTTSTGNNRPYLYAYITNQIRLWPVPDATYNIRVTGIIAQATLAADSDINDFTLYAANLIRHSAARRIYAETLRDANQAALSKLSEDGALEALVMESAKRIPHDRIMPTEF